MKNINQLVGANLRNLRQEKKYTQTQVAKLLNKHKSLICYWESGRRQMNVGDLADYLDAIDATTDERLSIASSVMCRKDPI